MAVIPVDLDGSGDVIAVVESESERSPAERPAWMQSVLSPLQTGTAGVVLVEIAEQVFRATDYDLTRVGSSPMFRDERVFDQPSPEIAPEPPQPTTQHAVLRMSTAEQALEVMAALNLNKTQLAEVLGVSRPTLYDWLEGKEPNTANALRLTSLVRLLVSAGVTAATPLGRRFVREALNEDDPSLFELLRADTLDEANVTRVLADAQSLQADKESARLAREERLRKLGFEEPSAERRKANLALNVALRDWPKD